MSKGIEFLEIRVLSVKSSLMVYQEKLLAKFGKYKAPETKEEALNMKVNMPKNAEDALLVMSDAHAVINELYDISVEMGREAGKHRANVFNQKIEIAALKTKLKRAEEQNKILTDRVFPEKR